MNAPLDAGQRASLEAALKSVTLDDKYTLERGRAYMSGIQALVRLPMLQQERDRAAGLNTAGFISGYRGSPLGGLDLSLWKAKQHLAAHQIVFQPGLNEDLAATAVWEPQQVNLYPGAKHDGVFGMWYGRAGVDRTGDVFKHANSAGSSQHGGVLVLAGDDHAAKSSTLAHQSEHIFKACGLPVLFPSNVQEYLDFGLHGWAMSRYSGLWVALKCVTDVVESSASVDIDPHRTEIVLPTDFILPEGGLNIRWPDPPLVQEARLLDYKWYAALAYVRANKLDRIEIDSPSARFGIMTGGKAYLDVRQALTDLGLDDETCARIGIRLYKVGCVWPLEAQGAQAFATKSSSWRKSARSSNTRSRKSCTTGPTASGRACSASSTRRTAPAANGRCRWATGCCPRTTSCRPRSSRRRSRRASKVRAAVRRACAHRRAPRRDQREGNGAREAARADRAQAVVLLGLPAQHVDQRAGRLARDRRHRLPLHDRVDGPQHEHLQPDGRRRRAVDR